MATPTTLVPLETYLETTYRPDCDWIDGELRERIWVRSRTTGYRNFSVNTSAIARVNWASSFIQSSEFKLLQTTIE